MANARDALVVVGIALVVIGVVSYWLGARAARAEAASKDDYET